MSDNNFKKHIYKISGYLTGDALNYLLGFLIFSWLIRIIDRSTYGYFGVAQSVYQVFMMVAAVGMDLVAPKVLVDAGTQIRKQIRIIQKVRYIIFLTVVIPGMILASFYYWRTHNPEISILIQVSIIIVFARSMDISYVPIALGLPGPLAKSKILSMLIFLGLSLIASKVIANHVWIVILIQAFALILGRLILWKWMLLRPELKFGITKNGIGVDVVMGGQKLILSGVIVGLGQLLLLFCHSIDVIWLNHRNPPWIVAEYVMIGRLYLFGTFVLTPVLNAFVPALLSTRDDPEEYKSNHLAYVKISLLIGFLGAILIWLAGPPLLELISGKHFVMMRSLAICFAVSFFIASIGNCYYSLLPILGLQKKYTIGMIITIVAQGGLLFLLPLRYGPLGVAMSLPISMVVLAAYSFWQHQRLFHPGPPNVG